MSVRGKTSIAVFVVVAFLAGVFFTTIGANLFNLGDTIGTDSRAALPPGDTRVNVPADDPALDLENAFTRVAEVVNPTVVQIRSEQRVEGRAGNPFEGTPFEDFFGPRGNQGPQFRSGLGSGVITRSDGYIITNNHVVEQAEELEVSLYDGQVFEAEVIGTDPASDLAVIKIDADGLPAISFGALDNVRVGQWVLAFGSPLSQDLENTVTAGIVSAMGRSSANLARLNLYAAFIQTDAAINPGNSGGPLVNLHGELVGINSAIYSRSGGSQGVGFAIPVNVVENVITQLIETGTVQRGFLGITFDRVSPALAEALDVPRGAAQISEVVEGSAADEAGLRGGDVIVSVDGKQLRDAFQLRTIVGNLMPGSEVDLEIVRDGQHQTVTVTLGALDQETIASNTVPRGEEESSMERLGIELQTLTPAVRQQLNVADVDDVEGVIITGIDAASQAAREAELRRGDIITEVD